MAPLGRVGLLGSTFQSFRADLPSVYHYLLRIMCVRHYTERIYDALDFWRNKTGLPHFVNTVFSKETVSVTIILIIKTRKCREKMEKQEKLDKIIFYVVIVIGILMILLQNGGKKKIMRRQKNFWMRQLRL